MPLFCPRTPLADPKNQGKQDFATVLKEIAASTPGNTNRSFPHHVCSSLLHSCLLIWFFFVILRHMGTIQKRIGMGGSFLTASKHFEVSCMSSHDGKQQNWLQEGSNSSGRLI